jgi:tripartite-type tricarboxylate transporter receptor subunit TctC
MDRKITRRSVLAGTAGAASLIAMPSVLRAQTFPNRPIELIVGFAAGGGTDVMARVIALFLERELGGSVVVNNKPGASGEIALAYVANAAPDGHVLGTSNIPGLLSLPIERKTQFKLADFHLLANIVNDPSAFSVEASSKIRNLADLVAAAKANPGGISYGSTGAGTDDHMALVMFEEAAGVKLNHIPFRGGGPLGIALLGSQIDVAGLNVGEAMPHGDKIRIIAQAGPKRSPFVPNVPTLSEAGFGLEMGSERGMLAPKGLPAPVAKRLEDAIHRVATNPEFVEKLRQQFLEIYYLRGDEWTARLTQQDADYRKLWARRPWGGGG